MEADRAAEVLENEFIRVEFDDRTMIARLIHKPSGRPMLEDVRDLLVFQKDEGNFQIEQPVQSEISCAVGSHVRRMYRRGNMGCAELEGMIPDPNGEPVRYLLTLTLTDNEPNLGMRVRVDWRSEAARLRLKLSSLMDTSANVYEIPFGVTQRKPYQDRFNCRGEWPAYRFACIEEPRENWGLALINRGTVGVESGNGVLYTTLLRAPSTEYAGMVPDNSSSAHGTHAFEFLLVPYIDGWRDSGVVEMAQRFNNPPLVLPGRCKEATHGLTLDGKGVALSAILKTPQGDTAVRIYETHGRTASATLALPDGTRVWASDLNEKRGAPLDVHDGGLTLKLSPFEIKTVLIQEA